MPEAQENQQNQQQIPERRFVSQAFEGYVIGVNGGRINMSFPAGNYYILESKDGSRKISTTFDGKNPIWVQAAGEYGIDDISRKAYDYYNVACPMDAYQTIAAAERTNESESIKLKAGSYYLVEQQGDYAKISTTADGANAYWVKVDENVAKNVKKADENVNPSNTNTVSGYQSADNTGVSKPNPKLVSYDREHFNSYIKNLITGSMIEFELPRGLSDNIAAEFENTPIRGRSMPFHGYSSTSDRTISISLPIQADFCKEEFDVTINKLRALNYPGYSNEVQPPICYVRLGNVIHDTFIINSVGVSYGDDGPFRDNKYTYAEVSLELVWVPSSVPSVTDIEAGKGM